MSASIYCTYEALGALLNLTMQYLFMYQDKPVGMFSILDHSTSKHFFSFFQGRGASMAIGGIVLNHSQYMRTCPPVYRNKVLLKHSHGQLLACIHSTMAVLRVATERTLPLGLVRWLGRERCLPPSLATWVEGENWLLQAVVWAPCILWHSHPCMCTHAHMCAHTHTQVSII